MRAFYIVCVSLCLAAVSLAAPQRVTEKIVLKFIPPEKAVRMLTAVGPDGRTTSLLAGVEVVRLDNAARTLTLRGTPAALESVKQALRLLDVAPRPVRLAMRLLRFRFEADGSWDVETVAEPTLITNNNETAKLTTKGGREEYAIEVTPRINGDTSVNLQVSLNLTDADRKFGQEHVYRRVPPGRRSLLLGLVTGPLAPEALARVRSGGFLFGEGPHVAYYLHVTPTVLPPADGDPAR